MSTNNLRFNVADQRLTYNGKMDTFEFDADRCIEFNHRHKSVLAHYDIQLSGCDIITLCDQINYRSNLGSLRNRQLRQSVILSAALSAAAVGLHGRGSLNEYPEEQQTKDLANELKRANDRTAAQIMAEVLQNTADSMPVGEEVLIESALTEGVRVKPGKEAGGNPTIAVGAVFGKKEHRAQYGLPMTRNVALLSMGNDVIDGTTKSVKNLHSSLTCLFVTEANIKRHLPDIYVQRWQSGSYFSEFNPREGKIIDAAERIASAYGFSSVNKLNAFFLDRPRHEPPMDTLNKAGVATPFDKDGDLMPALVMGLEGLSFPNGQGLYSMIGEIGGSAEWAVGALPLVWRGGQAIGMLTSQSSLTNKALSPSERWKERFHFTEEEFMQIQDARFEQKPYFTIADIVDDPFSGGVAAFGAITDNFYLPFMTGVNADRTNNEITVNVLVINSLGIVQTWHMTFKANQSLGHSEALFMSPKTDLSKLSGKELQRAIDSMLSDPRESERFRIMFNNEYYPALIPTRDRMVCLHKALEGLIERGALEEKDREIVSVTQQLCPDWFVNSD